MPSRDFPGGALRLPRPHEGQMQVRLGQKRFNWGMMGRRWRKTTMAMVIASEEAMKGKRMVWGAPTIDQLLIGWQEMYHAAVNVAKFSKHRMMVEFPRGGRVIFRSLDDPDNARGHTADGVILDEVADIQPHAWYNVLRPMLMDTGGWLWAIGTPKGRNWVWVEHDKAMRGDSPDSAAFQAPTLGCEITPNGKLVRKPHPLENPNIRFSELEHMFSTMPERVFREEIMAEFVLSGGAVFRNVRSNAVAKPQFEPIPGHEYVGAADWGKANDFTVFVIVDETAKEVCYIDRFNMIDYEIQKPRLQNAIQTFKPHTFYVESNSVGLRLLEEIEREPWGECVLGFETTNSSKKKIIDALTLAVEKGDIKLLDIKTPHGYTTVTEMEAFECEKLPGGQYRYSAPKGMHDDTVMAHAIAWHATDYGRIEIAEMPEGWQ